MILTDVGIAKIANSQLTNQTIDLTQIAVGDGDGAYYNPVQTATALKNEHGGAILVLFQLIQITQIG